MAAAGGGIELESQGEFDRDEWLAGQDTHMRKRFEVLFEQQDKVDELMEQLQKERHELEQKYNRLCEPILAERSKVVRGETVPEGGAGEPAGVPDFWARALASHESFEELLSNKDLEYLAKLQDIRVERYEDSSGKPQQRWAVKLVFVFGENDFMQERELTKTYFFADQRESIAVQSEGCSIVWKEGKDPTKKHMRKPDGKGGYQRKTKPVPSMFSFFTPPKVPEDASGLSGEDEEALEETLHVQPSGRLDMQAVEMDFALGSAIADDIVPCALKYYTGEAQDDDDFDPEDEEDDDDEDDDDDDDDEDDDKVPAPPAAGAEDQECKQQ